MVLRSLESNRGELRTLKNIFYCYLFVFMREASLSLCSDSKELV